MKSRLTRHLRIEPPSGTRFEAFSAGALKVADFDALAPSQLGHDPPLAARDEAVFLLHCAAEVEHALMVQYLYAAYSLGGPQVPQNKQELVDSWKTTFTDIAREEMGHLASVQNLLQFIGGPLNVEREDFPFRTGFYPFRFKLERLTKNSLAKYVYAEMPEGLTGDDINEIRIRATGANADVVNHVGQLYQSIASLFARKEADGTFSLQDADLQAEPLSLQAGEEWKLNTPGLIIWQVKTREGADDGAIPLIQAIAVQGEGMPSTGIFEGSHYRRFRDIYDAFPEEGDWQPSRVVPEDPNTSEPDPSPPPGAEADVEEITKKGRITHPHSRLWAQLFNLRYRMLLTNVLHLLRTEGLLNEEPKSKIFKWFGTEMRTNIRRLSSLLVEMPQLQEDTAGPPFAAPAFELPYTLGLADSSRNRWRLHRDLFLASQMLTQKIREKLDNDPASLPADLVPKLRDFLSGLSTRDAADLQFAQAQVSSAPSPGPVPVPPVVTPPPAGRFTEVKNILEAAVSNADIGAHGNFWRGQTRDQFIVLRVLGRPLLTRRADGTFDENESNLVKALEGRNPFGRDIGTPGANFRRMPAGLNPVAPEKVEVIRQWIKDGCPDDVT
jgi:Ferritin-like